MIKVRRQAGFSFVELLITVVVFVLVIAAASNVFTGLLTQFKQQSKIAETNIEGIIGLEILRRDIEHAGYGLPWDLGGADYDEAVDDEDTEHNDTAYNDDNGTDDDPPRAIVSGDGDGDDVGGAIVDTDVLVIKAVSVATNNASSKWTHLFTGNTVKEWEPEVERLKPDDRVIVLSPETTRTLVLNAAGDGFTTRYWAGTADDPDRLDDPAFAPADDTEIFVVYGVTGLADPTDSTLRMPFNRADYYVRTPAAAASMPDRCALSIMPDTYVAGIGILYKATVNQGDEPTTAGGELNELPLLDCVADMQVVYLLDTTGDGTIDTPTDDISALTAQEIRDQLREVRVYILAHEGQRDPDFTFTNFEELPGCGDCIMVGEKILSDDGLYGRYFSFVFSGIKDYKNYRWKVYTIAIKPTNLR